MKSIPYFVKFLEHFVHPSTRLLGADHKYLRFLFPAILSFCLIDSFLFGIFSALYLQSQSLASFSFGSSAIFVFLLFISKKFRNTRSLVLLFMLFTSSFCTLSVFWFEQANLLILLSRFAIYVIVAVLLSGRRLFEPLLGSAAFVAACYVSHLDFDRFVLPQGMTETLFMDSLLISITLSCLLVFALIGLYMQACDFSLAYMEKQKRWHDSNRLTKEFVNLAGDMNSVMQGPMEDVMGAIKGLKQRSSRLDTEECLRVIKSASEAVYGIARSFGVLAQDQRQAYNVRINLDELVRYATIVCETQFKNLGVELHYEPSQEPMEFSGPSGRWLLLLVSLLHFMAEQIQRTGGRSLHLKRQRKGEGWELVLTAEGAAPFEFPFELQQKLKEESTKELLEQTSGKAFLYLLDRWGLKLGSFQSA
jgi:hypothetical protein